MFRSSGSEAFEFGVKFSNWEWSFRNWNRVLEFGVAFSNLESYFLIRSGVLVFGVAFSNSELDVFELEVMFSNSE